MEGTEKQVQWAEKIKAALNVEDYKGKSPMMDIAIDFFEGIEDAGWWIEHKGMGLKSLCLQLMKGLRVGNATYTLSKNGKITKKWREIVNDGKGGHYEDYEVEM